MLIKDKVISAVVVTSELIAAACIAGVRSDDGIESSIHVLAGVVLFIGLELTRTWRMAIRAGEAQITQMTQEANEAGFNEGFRAAMAENAIRWEEGSETCLQSKRGKLKGGIRRKALYRMASGADSQQRRTPLHKSQRLPKAVMMISLSGRRL